MNTGTLIVGGGQAGAQAAFTLREIGYGSDITIVGSESHPPYQRPPLSKAFLSGRASVESLLFRKPAFYQKLDIKVISSARVTDFDLESGRQGTPSTAHLHDGTTLAFDKLLLAVGGRPRNLDTSGASLNGIYYLRTIDDATRLLRALEEARHVVVIGGGFVGLEAAAMARFQGKNVTVVEIAPRLITRALAPEMSGFLKDAHTRRGTNIRLACGVKELEGSDDRVTGVRLTTGELIPADIVIVGVGMTPRLELAEKLGLLTAGGIVVDSFAQTSDARVWAAGDCTVMPNPLTGRGLVRLESVQNAVDQAKVAAASMGGQPIRHQAVPWFWSNQGDIKLQMAGLIDGYEAVALRGSRADEKFSVFYYAAGRLVAVHAVNRPQDFMAARKALSQQLTIDPQTVPDDQVALQLVD